MIALLALIQAVAGDPPPATPPPTDTLRQAVIDAIRNCPRGQGGEVVVCSRDRGLAEGYRIPKLDPRFARNLRPSGRGELPAEAEAATGTGSCSNVGASGATGCTKQQLDIWTKWKRQQQADDQSFPW